ncbi:MAG: hypothetical protein WCS90_05305 [Bacilli bacterium]
MMGIDEVNRGYSRIRKTVLAVAISGDDALNLRATIDDGANRRFQGRFFAIVLRIGSHGKRQAALIAPKRD